MATRLGDATIKVAIDPGLARQELDRLSQEIEKIEKTRQESKDKADKDQADAEKKHTGSRGKGSGSQQSFFDKLLGAYKVGADLLEQGGLVGESIESAFKGTVFESIGKRINEKLTSISKEVIELRSKFDVFGETTEKVVEFNQAALHLGGKFPDDEAELIQQIHEITSAQYGLTRDMNLEAKKEFARMFVGGLREALGGGR